jgi:methylene-fatty-acyl-phospholipid synthase
MLDFTFKPVTHEFIIAIAAIVLHVLNYNFTARLEHHTRIFTKIIGKQAVYYYAVYLIVSALIRDHFIQVALANDAGTFVNNLNVPSYYIFIAFFGFGVGLNLWTLSALGIKGMYNGDSFGFLMDAPVTSGPYRFFSDPQYVGTTFSLVGSAFYYESTHGLILAVVLYLVFNISVELLEKPHMNRLYAAKTKNDNKKSK